MQSRELDLQKLKDENKKRISRYDDMKADEKSVLKSIISKHISNDQTPMAVREKGIETLDQMYDRITADILDNLTKKFMKIKGEQEKAMNEHVTGLTDKYEKQLDQETKKIEGLQQVKLGEIDAIYSNKV